MSTKNNAPRNSKQNTQEDAVNKKEENTAVDQDLTDSENDRKHLKQDTSDMTMPEVSDIPGQKHITNIGPLGEMADTTISSDDEEGIINGKDLLEDDDDTDIVMGTEADVTDEDLQLLGDPDHDMDLGEDEMSSNEGLDDVDFEGDPLNEGRSDTFTTGDDLDMPVADGSDPAADAMGQGDEENDYYSLDDNNDEEQ